MQARVVLVLSVALSSGCWEFHRFPSDAPPGAAIDDVCRGDACGASGSVATAPPMSPRICNAREPANNPGDMLCQAGRLEVHCTMAPPKIPCPATFAEAAELACSYGSGNFVIYCNECGGTSVRIPDELYPVDIHYDSSDSLQGVTLFHDDPVGPCEQHEFVFGRHCSPAETDHRGEASIACANATRLGGDHLERRPP